MKMKFRFYSIMLLSIFIGEALLLTGCKKDPVPPSLTTVTASGITVNSAITGGNITSDGGASVTSRGVCWGTAVSPVITGPHTSDSKGNGTFESNLTGLTPGTTYYIRAYAINKAGTAYGNELTFSTIALVLPVVTTTQVTGLTSTTAVSGGNITSDGGATVTERGICWSTSTNPTTAGSKITSGTGPGSFTGNITGLTAATVYHVRAYAINSVGTGYGNDIQFTTSANTPTLTTTAVSSFTRTTAVSGGNITSDGGAAISARGVCWSTTTGPLASGSHTTDGTGTGPFTSNLTGLTPNTLYFVRAYATNVAGTSYGNERSFTTSPVSAPTLTTALISGVTVNAAVSGGNITSDNGANVTERGICWNTSGNPTTSGSKTSDGPGSGSYTSVLSGLSQGSIYYVRAYATNSVGTSYGNQVVFSTSVTDIEANVYKTVIIGTQLWMQSDLKTTRYKDNTGIPNVTDNAAWAALTTPAYSWYNNDPSFGNSGFGILYNWFTVETAKLCPTGWHVPSDTEFMTLEMYLGMSQSEAENTLWRGTDQGTQLKSTTSWLLNGNGTNSSGFTALGGGYRFGVDGGFTNMGSVSYWWSSTQHWDTIKGLYRRLDTDQSKVYREGVIKQGGKYVRCMKD